MENKNYKDKLENDNFLVNLDKKFYKNMFIVFLASILFSYLLKKLPSLYDGFNYILILSFPLLLGGVFAYIINIPMTILEEKILKKIIRNKKSLRRGLSITISIAVIIVVIILVTNLIVPQLVDSLITLEKKLPEFMKTFISFLKEYPFLESFGNRIEENYNNFSWNNLFNQVKDYISSENNAFLLNVFGTATAVFSKLTNILVSIVFTIYILIDKEKIILQSKRLNYSLFTKEKADYLSHVFNIINRCFYYFIKGQLTCSIAIGIITFVLMTIFRLPYAAMISVLVLFLDLIPIIGSILAAILGAIFILIEAPAKALLFIFMMIVLNQIEGNIIYPKIVGNNIGLPPMWSLFAVLIGGGLMGILGMWIFVPLFSIIYILMGEFTEYRLKKKNISLE